MKKIEIFYIVVTIIIIIVIAISVYFTYKNYCFFFPIVLSILLLLYIWLGYFFNEVKLKKPTSQKFEVIPKKYRNTLKQNIMEKSVIVNLTLDEAKELYKSGNEKLKMLALKIFPEAALDPPSFTQIRSFEDAISVLGMNIDDENYTVDTLKERSKATAAMYKLNIIRKALNLGQDLHLTKDPEDSYIYYPYNPFVTKSSIYYNGKINSGEMEIIGKFKCEGEEYNVLNGRANDGGYAGLGHFYSSDGVGGADAPIGYLGCANEDIAKHFGKYFGMLITESKYGDMLDFEIIQ